MKKILILTVLLQTLSPANSQKIKFQEICKTACENFDNINKKYTKFIHSNGFNFNTMKADSICLYKNVSVKSYYYNNKLTKIEVIDTLSLGRNFDIDIIFESDRFYIGTVFFWDDFLKKSGSFLSGFFINDKVKLKSYLIERNYINLIINGSEKPKVKFPFNADPVSFFQFVTSVKIMDKKLFVKYDLEFKYRKFISYNKYEYKKNKIYKTEYIVKDKTFPYYFLEDYTINNIYKLFSIIFLKFNYQKNKSLLKIPSTYYQNKPLWIYE